MTLIALSFFEAGGGEVLFWEDDSASSIQVVVYADFVHLGLICETKNVSVNRRTAHILCRSCKHGAERKDSIQPSASD